MAPAAKQSKGTQAFDVKLGFFSQRLFPRIQQLASSDVFNMPVAQN
jgi:hypothetical protein